MVTPLKAERTKKGISTVQLALAVGVQPASINRIENMKMRASPDLADKIARYLGTVTRDQILFPGDYVDVTARKDATLPAQLKKAS